MEYMILPLKRYADFSGRSRRKEYWMFFLFCTILLTIFSVIVASLSINILEGTLQNGGTPASSGAILPIILISVIGVLFFLVPSIALQVRRFHDQDKSGWFVLLNFVPYVGGIIVLVFMCLEGTNGSNRYGEDPKNGDHLNEVFS